MYKQDNNSGVMWGMIALVVVAFLFLAFGAMANSKSDGVYIFSQVISGDVGDGSVAIAGHDNRVENTPVIQKAPSAFDTLGFLCGGIFLLICLSGFGYIVAKVMFNNDDF